MSLNTINDYLNSDWLADWQVIVILRKLNMLFLVFKLSFVAHYSFNSLSHFLCTRFYLLNCTIFGKMVLNIITENKFMFTKVLVMYTKTFGKLLNV